MSSKKRTHDQSLVEITEDGDVLQKSKILHETMKLKLKEIMGARKTSSNDGGVKLKSLLIEFQYLLIDLKEFNREIYVETERKKFRTQQEKDKMNQLNLQLQNLIYERNHLKKEIRSCQEFTSKYEGMSFVDDQELSSELIDLTLSEHQRNLNRLTYELQQRKNLVSQVEELKERKKALTEAINQKKKFLEGLQSRLGTISAATLPIQQHINLQISKQIRQYDLASRLVAPLYSIYCQIFVFAESLEKFKESFQFEVSIIGNVDDIPKEASEEQSPISLDKEIIYKPFPLSILVQIPHEHEPSNKLILRFEYLPRLNLITVTCTGIDHERLFLVNLFPNDSGKETPNLSNNYILPDGSFSFDKGFPGRPFKWAQSLAGLKFIPNKLENFVPKIYSIETIFQQIRKRMKNWDVLNTQLDLLNKLHIPSQIQSVFLPLKAQSSIESWKEISLEEFRNLILTNKKEDLDEWEEYACRYFKIILKKDSSRLQGLISIGPDYPVRPPFFRLNMLNPENPVIPPEVQQKSDPNALELIHSSVLFDNSMNAIETELNVHYDKLTSIVELKSMLLLLQIEKLKNCFDLHLDSISKNSKKNARVSGRDRNSLTWVS